MNSHTTNKWSFLLTYHTKGTSSEGLKSSICIIIKGSKKVFVPLTFSLYESITNSNFKCKYKNKGDLNKKLVILIYLIVGMDNMRLSKRAITYMLKTI